MSGRGVVYAQADIDQRTRLTGQAFLDGVAPGCGLTVHNQADLKKTDPLFHPVEAGVCKLDAAQTDKAIEEQLGGPLDTVSQRYAKPFAQMGDVLNFAASPYCKSLQQQGKRVILPTLRPMKLTLIKKGQK